MRALAIRFKNKNLRSEDKGKDRDKDEDTDTKVDDYIIIKISAAYINPKPLKVKRGVS